MAAGTYAPIGHKELEGHIKSFSRRVMIPSNKTIPIPSDAAQLELGVRYQE
ncbi:MAG TPA: hypothetical protein VJP02_11505 [Candidatus Sulfotelmatobacter sp.]|nr:hypothetical protein [Candidatus Sulfotelmatobacter sp.]